MGFEPQNDPLLRGSQRLILVSERALVVLMTLVIVWGVADVIWVLYERLKEPPVMQLTISDILSTFGAFIAVMITIEIFEILTTYLRQKVIEVELVMATALIAIALDYKELSTEYTWATAGVVLAMSAGYRQVKSSTDRSSERVPAHEPTQASKGKKA